jgi:hypothetical protein
MISKNHNVTLFRETEGVTVLVVRAWVRDYLFCSSCIPAYTWQRQHETDTRKTADGRTQAGQSANTGRAPRTRAREGADMTRFAPREQMISAGPAQEQIGL